MLTLLVSKIYFFKLWKYINKVSPDNYTMEGTKSAIKWADQYLKSNVDVFLEGKGDLQTFVSNQIQSYLIVLLVKKTFAFLGIRILDIRFHQMIIIKSWSVPGIECRCHPGGWRRTLAWTGRSCRRCRLPTIDSKAHRETAACSRWGEGRSKNLGRRTIPFCYIFIVWGTLKRTFNCRSCFSCQCTKFV